MQKDTLLRRVQPTTPLPRVQPTTPLPRVQQSPPLPRVTPTTNLDKSVPVQTNLSKDTSTSNQKKNTQPYSTPWQSISLRSLQQRYLLRSRRSQRPSYRAQALQHVINNVNYENNIFHPKYIHHIFDTSGRKLSLDKLLNGEHGNLRWSPALSNEWGRLAQGNDRGVESTNTIDFITFTEVPSTKKLTYASFACDHRPLKSEQWRVRIVVGGDKLPYESDSGSPAADMTETKILFNSVVSDAKNGARFCSMDLKDMFYILPCYLLNT